MKIRLTALITVLIAAQLLKEAETEECGYNRGVVRLQGGRNQREGRVEVCNDGWWGQLCENGWDNNDAKVVCRQLGLLTADTIPIAVNGSYFGQGRGSTWLGGLECTGTEGTILDCLTVDQQRNVWQSLQCSSRASVVCLETDGGESVRLVGGRSGREGRVEVYYEGAWGSVCRGNQWGTREAETVCKELGLFENGAIAVSGYQFGSARYGYTQVNGIQCFGNESHLITCRGGTWERNWCLSDNAGVVCTQTGGCTEGSIRLAGGQTPRQGRVEVCHGGIWGTVCKEGGSEWLDTDADIVCRELGFQEQDETGARALSLAELSLTSGVIWRFTANCGGVISQSCTPEDWTSTECTHSSDAAVTCPESKQLLHLCVNIEAQSLFSYGTLYAFYASVASRIVAEVENGCVQPCSYNTREISFETAWPTPIHPTTMCLQNDAILGIGIKLSYRPHLNENGRLQLAAHNILESLGMQIICSTYSRYVITKDFNLEDCASQTRPEAPAITLSSFTSNTDVLPTTTSTITKPPRTTPLIGEVATSSVLLSSSAADRVVHVSPTSTNPIRVATEPLSQPDVMSQFVLSTLPTTASTFDSRSVTLGQHTSSSNMDSSHSLPSNTVAVETPTKHNKTGRSIDYLMIVLISLLVVSLVLLFLCLLAALVLCARRRKTKKSQCANLSTSTQDGIILNSINPITSIPSPCETSYYEDVDTHEYAVLEHSSLSDQSPRGITVLSVTSGASSSHGYFVLDHPHKELKQSSPGKGEGGFGTNDLDPEGLYSALDHTEAEYATLEPEPGNATLVPDPLDYSRLSTGQDERHDYQRVMPDPNSDYDRTFANSLTLSPCL